MPSEIRHILFTDAEVGRALRLYRERTGTSVLPGERVAYTLDHDATGADTRFSMTVSAGTQSQTVSAAGAELVAALILYCRAQRIPLPATAAKSLQRMGRHLCLVVTRNSGGDALPAVAPLH